MEYQYPLDLDWTNDEMMKVIHFFNKIEIYYGKSDEVLNTIKILNILCPEKLMKNRFLKI